MNRRKKIKDILTKRSKQANLKANPKKSKPKYISKADRAKLEAQQDSVNPSSEESASEVDTTAEPKED